MRANGAFLVALVVLLAAGDGVLPSEASSSSLTDLFSCSDCNFGPRKFSSFVNHVRGRHGVDVKKGKAGLGDSHFVYCNSCPRSRDAHGKHMKTPGAFLAHLAEEHSIKGKHWVAAQYNCTCWWGRRLGGDFEDFVFHLRGVHDLDINMGGGALDNDDFVICGDDCNRRGWRLSMPCPENLLNHLQEKHGLYAASMGNAPHWVQHDDVDDMLAALSLDG